MRVVQILIASLVLGLAAGYAWSAMLHRPAHLHIPKAPKTPPIIIPQSEADKEWQERAEANGTDAPSSDPATPAEPAITNKQF